MVQKLQVLSCSQVPAQTAEVWRHGNSLVLWRWQRTQMSWTLILREDVQEEGSPDTCVEMSGATGEVEAGGRTEKQT